MNATLTKSVSLVMLTMALIAIAGPASAIETISQTKTTKFPIKIVRPGSYMLGSDIVPTSNSVDAIDVTASNVTINLNGFSIIGPGSGNGSGISGCTVQPCQTNVTVTNGTVTAMGSIGILLGDESQVEGVKATSNGTFGLQIGNDASIRNVKADSNGSDGIGVNNDSEVADSTANSNRQGGIFCPGNDCLIDDNTADDNGLIGIDTGDGTTVVRNSVSGNHAFVGLSLGANAGYGKNVMENDVGGCVNGGTSMGDNICNGVRQ